VKALCSRQKKRASTVIQPSSWSVHVVELDPSQASPLQPSKWPDPAALADSVIVVPFANARSQPVFGSSLEQSTPVGDEVTCPPPFPDVVITSLAHDWLSSAAWQK
jgi:hypothetical protein